MEPSGRKLKKKDDEQSLAVEPCINQHKKEISVTIKTMTGKRFPVSADPNDPIRILKMQIEKSEGMEKRLQKLMFTGRVLENAKTLNDYNLKEGDLIYLLKRNLKTSKGPNSAADSEDEDDDDDDDDEDDHDDDQIPIEIIYDKKALFKINVDREDSISDVKEKIWQNVDSNDLSLIYGGQKVEDSKTVKDYNYFKKLKLDISGDINLKIAPDFPVNVICQQVPYQTSVRSTMPVKEFRSLVSGMVKYPFILMCNRRILVDDKASLGSYDIKKPENILVIPESNGGNCLKFMLAIEKAETNGVDQLRESLNFLEDQETLNLIFSEGLKSIKAIKNYNTYKPEELLAVKLFTSDVLQKQLNDCLDNNKDLTRWSIYLKNFIKGLKHIDYYRGLAYRAIKDSQNTANYQKGAKISWKSIPGLTRNKEEAKALAGSNGTIIEIDVVSARNISELSFSSTEQIVLLPYSCFEVMEVINNPNQPLLIKLREIPIPRAAKVLFWVDDNPEYNYHYAKSVEEKGTSVVFCTSTKDALDVIESYKWLLSLDSTNFRVVSDMVRYENGVPQYTAGIDLLKALFNVYKYCFPVMIFCNNVQKAQENAKAANLHGHYQIANQDYQLEAYIYF